MSYIDRKESVIEIELTQFGKKLLSKGIFKPEYYQFFDDDIIYDNQYAGASDEVNKTQDRISEVARLNTRYTTTGLETRFEKESDLIEIGALELFEEMSSYNNISDETKLLMSPLGDMIINSQTPPQFKLEAIGSRMTNAEVTYLTQSGTTEKIPQLTISPEHKVVIDLRNVTEDPGVNYDLEEIIDLSRDKIEFLDGSFITQTPDPIIIHLEEHNVKYTRDNFELEIYEVVQNFQEPEKQDQLVPIKDAEQILKYFNIQVDESVAEVPPRPLVGSFFQKTGGPPR